MISVHVHWLVESNLLESTMSSTDEGGIENLNNPYPPPRVHEARACRKKGVGIGIE